jgi:hypothetical protein
VKAGRYELGSDMPARSAIAPMCIDLTLFKRGTKLATSGLNFSSSGAKASTLSTTFFG